MATKQNVYSEGDMRKTVLYRLKNVTTGDTVDVSADFSKITVACVVPISVNIPNFPTTPTWVGTVITVPQIGLANEAMYLMVSGGAT